MSAPTQVLVVAEHDNAHIKGATLNTVAAAALIGVYVALVRRKLKSA